MIGRPTRLATPTGRVPGSKSPATEAVSDWHWKCNEPSQRHFPVSAARQWPPLSFVPQHQPAPPAALATAASVPTLMSTLSQSGCRPGTNRGRLPRAEDSIASRPLIRRTTRVARCWQVLPNCCGQLAAELLHVLPHTARALEYRRDPQIERTGSKSAGELPALLRLRRAGRLLLASLSVPTQARLAAATAADCQPSARCRAGRFAAAGRTGGIPRCRLRPTPAQ